MHITKRYSLMTVGFSGITSGAIFVGDARELGLSLVTATTASSYTIQGSNGDGFGSAIPANEWSTMTVLTAQGIYAVQPGARWLRGIEAASTSSATMILSKLIAG